MALDVSLLLDLGIITIFAAGIAFFARMLRQPPILAFMIAGLLIGPLGFGLLANETEIAILSELGIAFLLFGVGIETNYKKLLRLGKVVTLGTVIHTFTLAGITMGLSYLGGLDFTSSLYVAFALAFSSTMLVLKILSDKDLIDTLQGRLMLGFLLMEDILIVFVLPLLMDLHLLSDSAYLLTLLGKAVLLIVIAFAANHWILPPIVKYASKASELLYLTSTGTLFGFLLIAHGLNFSLPIGAYIAGLTLSTLPANIDIFEKIRGLRDFFAMIFFTSIGVQMTLNLGGFSLSLMVMLFLAIFVFKPLLFFLVTLFSGYGISISILTAAGLAQVSEFAFIFAHQGLSNNFISAEVYSLIMFFTGLSMILTPYFISFSQWFENKYSKFFESLKKNKFFYRKLVFLESLPEENLSGHIIVVGAHVLGEGIIGVLKSYQNMVVLDHNPAVVWKNIKKGIPSVYGELNNTELLKRIGIDNAKLLLITVRNAEKHAKLISRIKKKHPNLAIFVKATDYDAAYTLYSAGADYVVLPEVMGANLFIKKISAYLESGSLKDISSLRYEFMHYLKEKTKRN